MNTFVYDSNALKIHTDGSSLILDKFAGGCAGIVEYPEECELPNIKLSWSYSPSTIGQMELRAVCNSLVWINKNTEKLKSLNISRIIIINDRDDNVNGINVWMYLWQKNKWKGKDGKSIKNLYAWKEVFRERGKVQFSLDVVWERGKQSDFAKEVDKLAKVSSKNTVVDKFNFDMTPRKVGRSITGNKFELVDFSKDISKGLIRVYYHLPINNSRNSEAEVRFELIKNNEVLGRFKVNCTEELNRDCISRQNYYEAYFNNDKSYVTLESVVKIIGKELENIKTEIKARYGRA